MNINKIIEITNKINGQTFRDVLKYLYVDQKMSSREIGKLLDTSHSNVCRIIKQEGIVRKLKC